VWSIQDFIQSIESDSNTDKLAKLSKYDLNWVPIHGEAVTNPANSLTFPLSKTYFIDQTENSQNILFGTDVFLQLVSF
jgi:hypothetical protein